MSTTIKLRSGLSFHDAPTMLRTKFEQWPWEKYDGDLPTDPNHVSVTDISRAHRLGARTSFAAYKNLIAAHGKSIDRLLKELPHTALEDSDLSAFRRPLVDLFDLVLGAKYIKLAAATKLLYPFRPSFLAVIDSVVENYYWFATSIMDESRFRRLQSSSWGEYVFELLALLREDVDAGPSAIDEVRASASGKAYGQVSRVRVVESLIWWYYVREGAPLPGGDGADGISP